MFTLEQLQESILDETRIIKHLYTKIDPVKLDYRPTPKQRSTLELLQFMAQMGVGSVEAVLAGNIEPFKEQAARQEEVTYENFSQKMDEQAQKIGETLKQFNETNLAEKINLWKVGPDQTRSQALIETLLKQFTAYRMQLFLYIKQSGNETINTGNVWGGIDWPVQQ